MKKIAIHLANIPEWITACGVKGRHRGVNVSIVGKGGVTCKPCKKTHWYKSEKSDGVKR